MLLLILFIIYIVSFFVVRYEYRLFSSKGYSIWTDNKCQLDWTWYFPLLNTVISIVLILVLLDSIPKEVRNKPKWKIFNWDL